MYILRLGDTVRADIDATTADVVSAKGRPWHARILADVPFHVKIGVGVTATADDFYVNEFEGDMIFAVGAADVISVLGTDIGKIWITEVWCSA